MSPIITIRVIQNVIFDVFTTPYCGPSERMTLCQKLEHSVAKELEAIEIKCVMKLQLIMNLYACN